MGEVLIREMVQQCIACRVQFENGDEHRIHYQSDWHCYNLKRKVAQLGPLTLDDFQSRKEKAEKDKNNAESNKKQRNKKKEKKRETAGFARGQLKLKRRRRKRNGKIVRRLIPRRKR